MISEKPIELKIIDMSDDGRGIGKWNGMVVFVPGPVPGDVVLAEIVKEKRGYVLARMLELKETSCARTPPFCEYARQCGGCGLQELRYEEQLLLKQRQVRDKIERIAGIKNPKVLPVIGAEMPLGGRNKAQIAVGAGRVGFYQAKSKRVFDCKVCPVNAAPVEALADALRLFMKQEHVSGYDPVAGKGLLRHLIVRTAFGTGEVMAILVINGKGIPNQQKLIGMMDDAVNALPSGGSGVRYSLESVALNSNTKATAEIMGPKCIVAAGKPAITDRLGHLQFEISPMSFYQVNTAQTKKLYDQVLAYAQLTGKETVLDLYCGIGAIGLYCAGSAQKVIGIESVKEAVLDANRNAVINGIVNAEFLLGRAEKVLPELVREGLLADVAILDPPRAGCKPELLTAVAQANPGWIVYVSCDPATLARDIRVLSGLGYRFALAAPVDMFPHTAHVECVVLMSKVSD